MKFASGSVYPQPSGHTLLKDSNRAWLCTTGSQRYEGRVNDTEGASSSQVCENEGEKDECRLTVSGVRFLPLSVFPWRDLPEFNFEWLASHTKWV